LFTDIAYLEQTAPALLQALANITRLMRAQAEAWQGGGDE
jgi:hypothetical protein